MRSLEVGFQGAGFLKVARDLGQARIAEIDDLELGAADGLLAARDYAAQLALAALEVGHGALELEQARAPLEALLEQLGDVGALFLEQRQAARRGGELRVVCRDILVELVDALLQDRLGAFMGAPARLEQLGLRRKGFRHDRVVALRQQLGREGEGQRRPPARRAAARCGPALPRAGW